MTKSRNSLLDSDLLVLPDSYESETVEFVECHMVLVGIDDTDIEDSRGTNQLARAIVEMIAPRWTCLNIIRHQLFFDPRVPYTSKNGSASIWLEPKSHSSAEDLVKEFREAMLEDFIPGSDPGLCVAIEVTPDVIEFGRRCKTQLVHQEEAQQLAASSGLHLEGLGGTNDGVIGALAAVGLAAAKNDGRIIHRAGWSNDFGGVQSIEEIQRRDVHIRELNGDAVVERGTVDLGKKLRPNLREGAAVLFVERQAESSSESHFQAVKLT